MKKFIYYGDNEKAEIISTSKIDLIKKNQKSDIISTDKEINLDDKLQKISDGKTKLAYVCNWNQQCGISTYSKFVIDNLKNKVDDYKIFSEISQNEIIDDKIIYCWTRGEFLFDLIENIKQYNPTTILIQHEWGIFPNAAHFMSFIIELKRLNIPIVVVLHSVYDHLDKQIPISVLDNVIVHSKTAKNLLTEMKFKGNIFVIPHGCPDINDGEEVFNIFRNPYLLFGYGFGFKYKGIETAIDAIKYLKEKDSKFKNILYIYVCSESENNKGVHEKYYNKLYKKVKYNQLENNILLIKGFLQPEILDIYLRTVKMVIFPYITEPHGVYGASGAIKIAMSYNIPVIASKSRLFDDVDGYVTRIDDYLSLAKEIDNLFSDNNYKEQIVSKAHEYISNNTWDIATDKYLETIK